MSEVNVSGVSGAAMFPCNEIQVARGALAKCTTHNAETFHEQKRKQARVCLVLFCAENIQLSRYWAGEGWVGGVLNVNNILSCQMCFSGTC